MLLLRYVPIMNVSNMPDQSRSPEGDIALAAVVSLLRRFATGQLEMPDGDTTQADYVKAGLQLAAFIDGIGRPGPQPDRGLAAGLLLILLGNAWSLPPDLDPQPGRLQSSLATIMDAVRS
jgi:hypothetical protein